MFKTKNKQGLAPVITTILLLLITITLFLNYSNWYNSYISKEVVKYEKINEKDLEFLRLEGGNLYMKSHSPLNLTFSTIKIDEVDCVVSGIIKKQSITSIDLGTCTQGMDQDLKKVTIVSEQGLLVKDMLLRSLLGPQINYFISVWNTSLPGSASDTIVLPLEATGTYNFNIDWGDNNIENVLGVGNLPINHTYTSPGVYEVKINGTIVGFRFNNVGDDDKITEIKKWGPLRVGNNSRYFYGCSNLEVSATDTLNLTGTTTTSRMFSSATKFNADINNWDVSKVTDMSYMFTNADSFNQDLNSWNTSSVTNMWGMFSGTANFNGSINNWDTSSVTTMRGMFDNADGFNQPLNNWNTSKVTTMEDMFYRTQNFNQDLDQWDVSSVTDMVSMFGSTDNFNGNISTWDTRNVLYMQWMFFDAKKFNSSINSWNVSNLSYAYSMFGWAPEFNQPLNNWDTRNLIDVEEMFDGAKSFNQDLNNWNMSKVTSTFEMFAYAENFNGNLDGWDLNSVTDMSYMFYEAFSFNQPLNNWKMKKVTNMGLMFDTAISFNQPLNNWNTSKVVNMYAMFYDTINFNQPLNNWNTSKVTNMWYMFENTSMNQDLRDWCVPLIGVEPTNFATDSPLDSNGMKPVWGTCPLDCSNLNGGEWVPVPGNAALGTSDFCVMKYEAKNVAGVATSQATNNPWDNIDQPTSRSECENLGTGYHLITNAQWTTIGRNGEQVASNWDSGIVGTGNMWRGHSDGTPNNLLPVTNTLDYYDGTGNSSPDIEKRILELSNGEIIWDLSGNAYEWVNETCTQGDPWYNTASWTEWTNVNINGTEKDLAGPLGPYDSTNSVGQYLGCLANGNGILRGNGWASTTSAGIFATLLGNPPSTTFSGGGFRCAYTP